VSLVVVPLPTGDPATDRQVRDVVARVLGGLPRHEARDEARPREPVIVAALEREGWDELALVHGRVCLPEPPSPGAKVDPDARRVDVFRRAIDAVLEHQAHLRLADGSGGTVRVRAGVVWLVVGVVPRGASHEGRAMQGFREAAAWADAAARTISAGRYVLDAGAPLAISGSMYVPWAYLAEPPSGAVLPEPLCAMPAALGGVRRTVVYTGRAAGGHALRWRDHGSERLFADMHALHALSASVDALQRVFGLPGEQADFYTLHSSTFEYPLTEGMRRERLRTLLSSGDGDGVWSSVLPDIRRIDEARERALPAVAVEAERLAARVRDVVERDELPVDHYDFGGAYRHRPEPGFDLLQRPSRDRWQGYTDAAWAVLDPPRQVDRIVADVEAAARACARDDGPRVIERAVRDARATIDALRHDLQASLGQQLATLVAPEGLRMSNFAFAVGATLAKLEAVRAECARHVRSPSPPADPMEEVERRIEQLRARCTAEEDQLVADGAGVPSDGGLALEVGAALLVVPIGLLAAPLLWRKRRGEQQAYFDRWAELSARWRRQSDEVVRPLVASVNVRAREVKKVAAQELAGVIEGCARRFRLEVRGFIDLVQQENSELQRRRAAAPPVSDAERVGRFTYAPTAAATMDAETRRAFETQLARILAPSLALVGMPERIAISAYDALLRQWLVTDGDEARVLEAYREPATQQFERAVTWGLDSDEECSDVGAFYAQDRRKVVLVGEGVARRLDRRWRERAVFTHDVAVIGAEDEEEASRIVARSFAPELAVCLVARGCRADGSDHVG
jgi:hypothetical protein